MSRKPGGFLVLPLILALCLLALPGCAASGGDALLNHIHSARQAAVAKAEPGTVLVEISKIEVPRSRGGGFFFFGGGGVRTTAASGLIVTPDGVAKVLDFGLAKLTDATLTGAETTMGTVAIRMGVRAATKEYME